MIIYKGIHKKDTVNFIIFENQKGKIVEIPIEEHIAYRFLQYLDKIAISQAKFVEAGNDEPSE